MKKILLASTAIVAFCGAAAADVSLSGRAEMGIVDSDADDISAQFFTDIDVTFTMSGETDGGLAFGASVDLDEGGDGSAASDDNSDDGGATIFISGGFGTVTMGDTDGALDWALSDAGNNNNGGSINDDETEHAGYNGSYLDGDGGNDGQILRYNYTAGAFGFAISYEQGDTDFEDFDFGDERTESDESDGFAIGVRYGLDIAAGTVNFGLGYQEVDVDGDDNDLDGIGLSIAATFDNGLAAGITYLDGEFDGDDEGDDHIGVGIGYTTGAITLHANYGQYDYGDDSEAEGFGLSAAYDLGGGAVVHAGYGDSDFDDDDADFSTFSLGLGLSF
ncbi:porin [Litoreibacter roseus]|uniref:Porin n=1 Tax=Litoreibacter roseus TaxID=2601869 RepID=A0A6N6JM52_9RHOB|nr:porin [Litoreibacter roseus]GFE66262.1 porin [Litoreibacter roseus]